MKVLLIQDVDNLGYAGEVKDVADGYGRNYLLPQKMAILATAGALKQAETIRKAAEKIRAQEMADAQAIANQLADLELIFERRAGDTGKLYGSVTSSDISEAIKEKTGIEVDRRKIALSEPIRNLGHHEVIIKLMIDLATQIKVEVVTEGTIVERARKAAKEAAKKAEEAAKAEAAEAQKAAKEVEAAPSEAPSKEEASETTEE